MAVAYDASSESHPGTSGSTSEASFTWNHNPTGTPKGVLIFVMQDNASTDKVTSVTYGGTTVPAVSGGFAADTLGEIRACKAFFLGAAVPTGTKAVVVNRTNDTTLMYAVAATVTAAADTTVHTPGIVLQQADTSLVEQNVTDGSVSGTNSVRFAGGSFALNGLPGGGANSSAVAAIDFGSQVAQVVRETTAGQGSRPVGFSSGTSDDVAAVYLAVREALVVITIPVTPGALTLDTQAGLYDDIYEDIYTDGVAGGIPVTASLPVSPAAITLTGSAVIVRSKVGIGTKGKITLTGKVVVASGTVVNTIITVTPGALVLGGTHTWDDIGVLWDDPDIQWDASANIEIFKSTAVTPGAITLTGQAAALSRYNAVTPGAITLTGQNVAAFAEGGSVFIAPDPGVITLAGSSVVLSLSILVTEVPVVTGAVTLVGKAIVVKYVARVTGLGTIFVVGQSIHISPNEDDQGEDEDHGEVGPFRGHAGSGRISSPDTPGLHRLREHVGLER